VARNNVPLRDFTNIDGAPLAYDRLGLIGALFREFPRLDPTHATATKGLVTTADYIFVRRHWELPASSDGWRPFAKGGEYCRSYSDVYLRLDWRNSGESLYAFLTDKTEGSPTRWINAVDWYGKAGLTWPRRTQRGFNVRVLPDGCIFADKGPAIFPHRPDDRWFLLGVLSAAPCELMMKALTSFGSWEVGAVKKLPVPTPNVADKKVVATLAQHSHDLKAAWDVGNEVCTRFEEPWLLHPRGDGRSTSLMTALDVLLSHEVALDADLTETYGRLHDAVYRLYGVNEALRAKIENAIGERPPEVVWPQMEGKTAEQRRMEHVCRLLTYAAKCVIEEDDDGLVSLQSVAQEQSLLERVRAKLASFFPDQDSHTLEIEIVNELKKRAKGFRRAETLQEWLTDAFFDFHCDLYQQRPILWNLASSQDSADPAFSVIVHYHRFDHDLLAKLRSVHVRDRMTTLRREAAQASKDGREDDRLQFLAALEEVEAFDRKLARLHEGHHAGAESGDDDYRILTPWKKPADRPKGWQPDIDDGVKVNIAPLARTGLLRNKNKFGQKEAEE
jgi:hypothetical protein